MNEAAAIVVPLNSTPWDEYACIDGCRRNHLPSQEMLYRRFYPRMMAVVLRYTSDQDEAGTILNNGFLRVFKKIGTFGHQGSLEGWVRRIIVHAVSDHFRYKHPPKEVPAENISEFKDGHIFTTVSYDYNKLLALLYQLPAATRAVVNLFIIEGYTHKEIGEMMGISENTSKWHVSEGRKLLKEKLKKYGHG